MEDILKAYPGVVIDRIDLHVLMDEMGKELIAVVNFDNVVLNMDIELEEDRRKLLKFMEEARENLNNNDDDVEIWRPIFDENDKEQIIVNYNSALKVLKITNAYSNGSDFAVRYKVEKNIVKDFIDDVIKKLS